MTDAGKRGQYIGLECKKGWEILAAIASSSRRWGVSCLIRPVTMGIEVPLGSLDF